MKKHTARIAAIISCAALVTGRLTSYSSGFFGNGYTGSPGNNGMTCVSCHSGSPVTTAQGAISSNIPSSGYVPGQSYIITITAQHPTFNTFGFMLTAESSSGAKAGNWTILNTTETQLTAGGAYVSHTSSGISGMNNSKTWTVQWTAPTPGVGQVTFYAAINRANGNFSTSGDQIQTATLAVSQFSPPPPPPLSLKIDTVIHEVCLNGCNGSIQASHTGGIPPVTYSITGGSFINLCGGQYWVKVTDSVGQKDSLQVTVQNGVNPPVPDIIYDQQNILLYTTAQAAQYQWLYDGQPIPNSNNDTLSLVGLQPGEYSVTITDIKNCQSTSQKLTVIFGNIHLITAQDIRVLPNPCKRGQSAFFEWNYEPGEWLLFDTSGRLLKRSYADPGRNFIHTEHLKPGTYLIVIRTGNLSHAISKMLIL
ncbi:MAG: choice-of-anchor V domain-containing protein [Thermaurantimonas sp.]|uniref:choice-of-anchor V domain-containing protein n=1 Tax=Thermaurantimonas sp. TaxID=2681568 RepID=UPI003919486A